MSRQRLIRKTDVDRLNQWVNERGADGMATLVRTGLSIFILDRMLKGTYGSSPKATTRKLISDATGIPEDVLFPIVREKKKAAS